MDDLELDLRCKILDVVTEALLARPELEMTIWGWVARYCGEIVNKVESDYGIRARQTRTSAANGD